MAEETEIHVILQMMMMSYNLWELYIYGHLHDFANMKITKFGYINSGKIAGTLHNLTKTIKNSKM